MNQSPLSMQTLTPPPEKVRTSTRKVLFWLILAAIAITGARWYFDEMVLPNRPLKWRTYDRVEAQKALGEKRKILLLFESEENSLNIAMRDAVENKRVRRLVRRNHMLTYRVNSEVQDDELQRFLDDFESPEPPAILVLVGKKSEARHGDAEVGIMGCIKSKQSWEGEDISADAVYESMFELRFGRKPAEK